MLSWTTRTKVFLKGQLTQNLKSGMVIHHRMEGCCKLSSPMEMTRQKSQEGSRTSVKSAKLLKDENDWKQYKFSENNTASTIKSFPYVAEKGEPGKSLGWKVHSAIWDPATATTQRLPCVGTVRVTKKQAREDSSLDIFLHLKISLEDKEGAVADRVRKVLLHIL